MCLWETNADVAKGPGRGATRRCVDPSAACHASPGHSAAAGDHCPLCCLPAAGPVHPVQRQKLYGLKSNRPLICDASSATLCCATSPRLSPRMPFMN